MPLCKYALHGLKPLEKNLAILSHYCFVWQYCNIDGGFITQKRRDWSILLHRPVGPCVIKHSVSCRA